MPSRRELIQLTPQETDRFLRSQRTVILVSNGKDGYPHPMPMWFHLDDAGVIHCTTFRKSQKVMNLRRDPRAALLAETGEEYAELKSVLIYARAEIVDDRDTVVDVLVKISNRSQEAPPSHEELMQTVAKTAPKRVVLRLTPERYVSWDHTKLAGRY